MSDLLPPIPPPVQFVLEGRDPVEVGFAAYVQERLEAVESLTIADCCSLLAGLHIAAYDAAAKYRKAPDLARRRGRSVELLLVELAESLARYELLADAMRGARRAAVGVRLGALQVAAATRAADALLAPFVDEVVWPLLCRAWLPALFYEDPHGDQGAPASSPPARRTQVWRQPALTTQMLRMYSRSQPEAPLSGILRLLDRGDQAAQSRAAAVYLRAAESARAAYVRAGCQPVSARVLFASTSAAWQIGHALQVLVVPDVVGTETRLTAESLNPAYSAAKRFLGEEPLPPPPPGASWQIVVGDYPGGGESRTELQGFSAGAVLGAAFVAHAAGLSLRPDVYASARLSATGAFESLGGSDGSTGRQALLSKGRAAALIARTGNYPVAEVVVAKEDVPVLAEGVAEVGAAVSIAFTHTLGASIGHLVGNMYSPLLALQIAPQHRYSGDEVAGVSVGGFDADVVAEQLLRSTDICRWIVPISSPQLLVSGTAGAQLATALSLGDRRGRAIVALALSWRQLYKALLPVRGAAQSVAELLVSLMPEAVTARQRRARCMCIEEDLRHGQVMLVVSCLSDGVVPAQQLASTIAALCHELDPQVQRIVTLMDDTLAAQRGLLHEHLQFADLTLSDVVPVS